MLFKSCDDSALMNGCTGIAGSSVLFEDEVYQQLYRHIIATFTEKKNMVSESD